MNGCTHDCNQGRQCTCIERLIPAAEMHPAMNIMSRRWFSVDGTRRGVFRGYPEQLPPRDQLLWGDVEKERIHPVRRDDHGRCDMNCGLGYTLIGAVVFWLGLAGWMLWRVW